MTRGCMVRTGELRRADPLELQLLPHPSLARDQKDGTPAAIFEPPDSHFD
jgi:hypothetical protein